MTETPHESTTLTPDRDQVLRLLGRRNVCTLATVSAAGRPHVAAVLYAAVGSTLYVSTDLSSRKARNIAHEPNVGVCVPVRRLPVGPPSSLQFQGVAEILATDDPHIAELAEARRIEAVTGHGELDRPDGCFLRITPTGRVTTYGIGMPLIRLLRDPLNAAGVVDLAA